MAGSASGAAESTRSERLIFAGFEAALGLFVLGVFWLFGALGLAGGLILVATGEVAGSGELWFGLAVLAAFVGWFGWTIARGLRQFRTIDMLDDGRWLLRNPLGVVIGRIAADQDREAVEKRAETWMFTGTARKFTKSWIEVRAAGRTWRSTHSIPRYQAAARQGMDRWFASRAQRRR
ncbi:MAG TPA: hypothetical protein VNO30_15140 [Kofleriaceae bacterium]|nr:hypothetical protein [Kofleriaceae bacterium]